MLYQFLKQKSDRLLYRGSRDGFTPSAFHTRCDGKANTVTVVKSNSNYIFGGFTSQPWKSDGSYSSDPAAFIFSYTRNGTFNFFKFKVADPSTAIWNNKDTGPVFGSYENYNFADILIGYGITYSNYADFGSSYTLPKDFAFQDANARSYLAGSFFSWSVTEIEVYQVTL